MKGESILGDVPVFGRETDSPEFGRRLREFDADLRLAVLHWPNVDDAAVLSFLRGFMRHCDSLIRFEVARKLNQRAMSIDDKSLSLLFQRCIAGFGAANDDGNGQKDAQTAATALVEG